MRVPWARLAGLLLLGALLGAAAYFLRPEAIALIPRDHDPPATSDPARPATAGRASSRAPSGPLVVDDPEELVSPAPRARRAVDSSLDESVMSFRDSLASGDLPGVLSCFEPSARSQRALQSAMAGLLDALETRELRPGSHLVEEQAAEYAKTVIFFHASRGGSTVGIPVEWYRRNGTWYPKTKTYSFAPGE